MPNKNQRSLIETSKHHQGKCGGFSFGGQHPEGVTVCNPLPPGTVFPNGATAALLLTFDVEGTYGNGTGDMALEIANYQRMCDKITQTNITATFNVLGKMAHDHGPQFVKWMLDAQCEVAPHSYIHDMNKRYGGDKIYAGHYGPQENLQQISDGIKAINNIKPAAAQGIRIPYGHFNEYTYNAAEQLGLTWTSNLGIDDFLFPTQGFGNAPFQIKLADKLYPIVEIPLDSQTYDWAIWIADKKANASFVKAVQTYCDLRNIPFERSPSGAVKIWHQRMLDTIKDQTVFTFLCHPINLTVKSNRWTDPVTEFLFPVFDQLGDLQRDRKVWVCTCTQLIQFYWQTMKNKTT